jgi:tRNA A-37 threonylcarbamoyl transferase component Bud32
MKPSNPHTCPKCAGVIPDEAPGGLCPKCALEGVATVPYTTPGGRKSPPPGIAEIAPHFPELEILELIGAGGMGAVYKARQPQLDRMVALKILSHDLAGDPAFFERFNREARVLAHLSHPNIVGIHDFGTTGPYCYLTMEYVDGVNLRQAMQAGRFTPTEALAMVQHLCSALKFAHEEGILHRDIKPENILIDSKGRVKIADFGIAKLVGDSHQHDFTLTLQGSVLGSPHYMAPEQIETPGDVDQRADIYSLGVVLYEMLTGGLPIGRFALPSEKAEMDARIDHIVMRTLEKEREARYQSAGEVSTEVETLGKNPAPVPVKPALPNAAPETARFSGLSAILTGISLPLVFIVAYLFLTIAPAPNQRAVAAVVRSIGEGWALFHLFTILGTALPGFIFGTRALGEIRTSGGAKGGLVPALFSVTAWPILMLFVIALFSLPGGGMSWDSELLLSMAALTALITGFLLVRALRRWTLGANRGNSSRFQPGLGLTLVIVVLVAVGLPIFISQWQMGFSSPSGSLSHRLNPYAAFAPEISYHNEYQIDWRLGEPERTVNLWVLSDMNAEFFLVLKDAQGKPVKNSKIGAWEARKGKQTSIAFAMKIGTLGPKSDNSEADGGIAAHMNLTGESTQILGLPDIGEWQFAVLDLHDTLPLYERIMIGMYRGGASIRVAEHHEMINGTSTLTATLELEVRAVQVR